MNSIIIYKVQFLLLSRRSPAIYRFRDLLCLRRDTDNTFLNSLTATSYTMAPGYFFFFLRGEILMDTQLQAAWVVSDSYRLKLHGGLPDGCSRRAQDLLQILPSAPRRLSPCWAGDFLVRQKIGAARGDHTP